MNCHRHEKIPCEIPSGHCVPHEETQHKPTASNTSFAIIVDTTPSSIQLNDTKELLLLLQTVASRTAAAVSRLGAFISWPCSCSWTVPLDAFHPSQRSCGRLRYLLLLWRMLCEATQDLSFLHSAGRAYFTSSDSMVVMNATYECRGWMLITNADTECRGRTLIMKAHGECSQWVLIMNAQNDCSQTICW
jgi:hypothetical protein